jgi:hypothetical protein
MQLYIGSHNSHGGKSFLMYGALLQTGGTKTVFTDGTRSSTQSLIDLTKTSTINVSNVSFDSTGQPTFDGTDDYIELTVVSASINGNSLTTGGTLTGTFSPTAIGRNGDGQYWDGALQNIKIYNRALSADEVQQNYNAYKNRFNL